MDELTNLERPYLPILFEAETRRNNCAVQLLYRQFYHYAESGSAIFGVNRAPM
jgi:hypothetical protein